MRTGAVVAELASLVGRALERDASAAQALRRLELAFNAAVDRALAHGTTAAEARLAVDAGQVAIRLGIASKALQSVSTLATEEAAAINGRLAQASLLDAMAPLGRLVASGHLQREWPLPSQAEPEAFAAVPAATDSAVPAAILLNICRHHREHERFYVQDRASVAADLQREATKLKVVAEAWLTKPAATPDPAIDYSLQAFAPAGCPDLNELNAIAMVGVLFMEGEGEPIEIKVLKAKLSALASAWRRAGEWLSSKMEAAWDRERAMFARQYIAVAHQRFNTIVMNWRGSRERLLAARVLEMALRVLESISLEPRRIRAERPAHALRLFEAASILATAAQLVGRTASDLADNDPNWTDCIRHLETVAATSG